MKSACWKKRCVKSVNKKIKQMEFIGGQFHLRTTCVIEGTALPVTCHTWPSCCHDLLPEHPPSPPASCSSVVVERKDLFTLIYRYTAPAPPRRLTHLTHTWRTPPPCLHLYAPLNTRGRFFSYFSLCILFYLTFLRNHFRVLYLD